MDLRSESETGWFICIYKLDDFVVRGAKEWMNLK